ncbi:sensor domain-containing diguanylate cyclase [Oceanospirillum sediminis]|uniref:Diguanylate cyclase n=1 Tax=Oceanospirillum sediminis TaxID=2760088 RepID=A0A839IVL0_9GAMM|nr:diguanylate cyclase [Oceanospirillum sediminis]MBB1489011.1 diguanylate cyclase [Oceanospirillum sediminis]
MDWLKGKKHFFLFVSLLIAFIDASLLFINYRLSSTAFYSAIETESKDLNAAFHALVDQTGEHLELMAAYIANDDDVIRLINEGGLAVKHEGGGAGEHISGLIRQELYESVVSKWRYIQDHSDIYQLSFYSGVKGLNFLRVHRPEYFGDTLPDSRRLFNQVIQSGETVSGIETGRYASNLSGLAPVFHFDMDSGNRLISGVVEVGSSFQKDLLGFQKRLQAGAGVMLPDSHHSLEAGKKYPDQVAHLPCDCVIDEASDFGVLKMLLSQHVVGGLSLTEMNNMIIPVEGRYYAFMVHDLYPSSDGLEKGLNAEQNPVQGNLVFWLDYTTQYQSYKQSLQLNALLALMAFVIVELLILVAIRFYTRRLESDVYIKTKELSCSEQQLKTAQKLAHIGHWEWNLKTDVTSFSDEVVRILAFEQGEKLSYQTFLSRVHADDREEVDTALRQAIKGGGCNLVHKIVRPNGKIRHIRERVVVARDQAGQSISMLGTMQDITPQIELQRALEAKEYLYRQMFERNKAVKLLIDPASGSIVDANPAAVEYYGYKLDVLRSMNIEDINILSQEEISEAICRANDESKPFFHFQHRLCSGEVRDVEVYSGPVSLDGEEYLNSIVFDVTERNQLFRDLEQVAFFDALTSLPNRRSIDNYAEKLMAGALSGEASCSVIMLDIDHFKRFNDTWGHDAGDLVLQKVAMILKRSAGVSGFAGRFGGEEFIILLSGGDYSAALSIAENTVRSVRESRIQISDEVVQVTISAGVATLMKNGHCLYHKTIEERGPITKFKQLVKQADECLYLAKMEGRNCAR